MTNSEKILKTLSNLIENGILTSKDIKNEISTDLKFKKDKLISKLDLVSREKFEVLKKLVQKQDALIKKFSKKITYSIIFIINLSYNMTEEIFLRIYSVLSFWKIYSLIT